MIEERIKCMEISENTSIVENKLKNVSVFDYIEYKMSSR